MALNLHGSIVLEDYLCGNLHCELEPLTKKLQLR